MTDTTFVDQITVIEAPWFNDVNDTVYGALGAATTASDARINLGLGTIATQNANSVTITGGNVSGITDLAIADGGTGASTAAAARTNLQLGTLATQNGTFSGTSSGTNTGDQNIFSTVAVSGQSDVVADSTADTLTLAAGSNITITTNATTDTITIAATGGGDMTLAGIQTVTGAKTFNDGKLLLAGSSSGTTTLAATAAASGTITLPAATDTLVGKGTTDTFTGAKTFNDAKLILAGATSGTTTVKANATAGSTTQTFQAVTGTVYCTGGTAVAIGDGGTGQTSKTAAFNALSPLTTQGDIMYHNGTDVVRLAPSTSGFFLKTNGAGANPSWAAASGVLVQRVSTTSSAMASGSTTIPLDDTIPQNTEGDQYLSLAITPSNSANILVIEVWTALASSAIQNPIVALFQDTTANALAANVDRVSATNTSGITYLRHIMTAGTTSATTFKMRAGCGGAATVTFNGQSAARLFGGVFASGMMITEYTS